ncbi:hypothetical protein GKQ77_03930 [Streptomyces sp. BG9H]|uniref:Uncharacterized protein n=1 Tax=Streptomyces anatolicus TaxID=2675858 RepID=A0ABS6YHY0_9ACTN|nr:hypothetical protein [Streptomyces anatolicus]MBW5420720.1 hypothetical protein [Streptomyces anatolicus]
MRDDENDVRRQLRAAADAHRPDRERMLARVERGMAGRERTERRTRPPRGAGASWLRVVTATAAVAGVCAVAGYGVASALRGAESDARSVATSSTPDAPPAASAHSRAPAPPPPREPSGTPDAPPASGAPKSGVPKPGASGGPKSDKPSAPADPSRGARTVPAAELLWADGSIDPGSSTYWSQSDITVKAKKPLTALTVELRVARGGEVADTGNWRSLPAGDFAVTVTERDGSLLYRWTLRAGRTVPAGEHVFAGQYDHPEGARDAHADRYTVRASTGDERAEWKGDFAPSAD